MFQTAASFINPLEAHIALGRLKAEGIDAVLLHECHVWANWMYSQALGGVKILVAAPELERARAILALYHQGAFAQELEERQESEEAQHCPVCHSLTYRRQHGNIQLFVIVVCYLLFGWILPLARRHFRCQQCRAIWRERG